jgi:hypothetical protein
LRKEGKKKKKDKKYGLRKSGKAKGKTWKK